MPGLKKHFPEFQFSGAQVSPGEIDRYEQYCIIKPSASDSYVGTVDPGTVAGTFVLDNTRLDYPRNLLVSITGPAGGVGGTVTITGKDQFGVTQTETISVASANGGGTTAGSNVYAEVSLGTYDPNGGDNQSTAKLGVAIGTAADDTTAKLGLPAKIGGTADVKAVTWIDNGTAKEEGAASIADTTFHAIKPAQAIAAADDYIVLFKPTYDAASEANNTGL